MGSTSAISKVSMLFFKILSKLSCVIGDPDFRKTSLTEGKTKLFLVYFPRK